MPQNPLPAPPTDLADFEEVKTELNILLSENVVIPSPRLYSLHSSAVPGDPRSLPPPGLALCCYLQVRLTCF